VVIVERKTDNNLYHIKIGLPMLIIGVLGMLLIFFLLISPYLIVFLLSFYPFLALFITGIILVLSGFRKIQYSRGKLITLLIIMVGAFMATFGLNILVPYIFRIL